MSRTLTRDQVLAWRDNWSVSDKALIRAALDVLPDGTTYYETSSYAAARVEGRVAVYIEPGYLSWPGGRWSSEIDPEQLPTPLLESGGYAWCPLSTFRPRDRGKPSAEQFTEPCPDCNMVPARNGACLCE